MPREIQKMALAVLIFSEGFGYDIKQTSNSPKKPKMTDKTGDVTSDRYVNWSYLRYLGCT